MKKCSDNIPIVDDDNHVALTSQMMLKLYFDPFHCPKTLQFKPKHQEPQSQMVLQTAYGNIELVIRSVNQGAVDFSPKPWDKEKAVTIVINARKPACSIKEQRPEKQPTELHKQLNPHQRTFIASPPLMHKSHEPLPR